jgi:hypothetical protein
MVPHLVKNEFESYFTSELELLYDWRLTANQFVLASRSLRLTTSDFIFQLKPCCFRPYVTSSMTRGWMCRLQLLLGLASSVILLSQIRGSPTRRASSPYLNPSGTGQTDYTPRHQGLFSLPPTTTRITVEVFDPACTWDSFTRFTWRHPVSRLYSVWWYGAWLKLDMNDFGRKWLWLNQGTVRRLNEGTEKPLGQIILCHSQDSNWGRYSYRNLPGTIFLFLLFLKKYTQLCFV